MKALPKSKPDVRWWDGLAALLLMCGLITVSTRMVVTQWTEDLHTIQSLVLLGGLFGLALGQSRFSARAAFYFALGYGLPLIIWHLGSPLASYITWKERLVILSHRLTGTVEQLVNSTPVNDNILFLLLMSVLFWGLGVHAGYSLTRWAGSWRAAIPPGLALMVIHVYDSLVTRRIWFLAAYLLFGLLLVARTHFIRQRLQWRENRTYIPPDIGFDWIRYTMAASVFLIMFAWTVPALAETLPPARYIWQRVKQPWDDFTDQAGKAFNSLQASVGLVHEQYGGSMPLSRGTELSDALVMRIEAPARLPGMRYYWRAYTYDNFDNATWSSTFSDNELVFPEQRTLKFPDVEVRELQTFVISPEYSILTLYTPTQPLWVSVPAEALLKKDLEGNVDLAAFTALNPVFPGQRYEVQAAVSSMTVAELREAGTDYPDWVIERYLQLPDTITQRTIDVAGKIAADLDNPYDIAAAVTDFLRQYEYREIIDAPPVDQDVIDWWLFDYQAGFCQYYASAEVVILRLLGIPSRMAVGFAQGDYVGRDSDRGPIESEMTPDDFTDQGGIFLVKNREAHAWPEVYFPGYGWVEFEPTASQNPIFRPVGSNNIEEDADERERDRLARQNERLEQLMDFEVEPSRLEEYNPQNESATGFSAWWAAGPVLAALVVVLAWRRRQPTDLTPLPVHLERGMKRLGFTPPDFLQRWAYQASQSPLTRSYLEINRALRRLGSPPAVDHTPAERAAVLAQVLPATKPHVESLLVEYQLAVYSRKQANVGIARQSAKEIRKLSFKAILQALISGREEAYKKVS
jgi:transglutaminase-like putative cysteine protease